MKPYVVLDKKLGQTPLEAIQEWKAANPEYADTTASYAGRLDPMATGLLLILLGDECKRKEAYTGLDKEYVVEVLLDVRSDTGDVLGIVEQTEKNSLPTRSEVQSILRKEEGTHLLPYPHFSSKTVSGTPLFMHALQGTINTIEIPEHEETFYAVDLISIASLSTNELQARIKDQLAHTPVSEEESKAAGADFRIHAVRNSWQPIFLDDRSYAVLRLRVTCGSGAYMRTLAQRIGNRLGTKALALSIHRARIGTYKKFGPLGIWLHLYRSS
jgi:tRNA pseudouridine(55) synthase